MVVPFNVSLVKQVSVRCSKSYVRIVRQDTHNYSSFGRGKNPVALNSIQSGANNWKLVISGLISSGAAIPPCLGLLRSLTCCSR